MWSLLRTVRQGCDKQHKAQRSHDTGGGVGGVGGVWGHVQEITHKRSAPVAPSIHVESIRDIVRLLRLNAGYFLNDGEPFPVTAQRNVAFSPCSIGEWLVEIVIKKKKRAASNEPVKHSRKGGGGTISGGPWPGLNL